MRNLTEGYLSTEGKMGQMAGMCHDDWESGFEDVTINTLV